MNPLIRAAWCAAVLTIMAAAMSACSLVRPPPVIASAAAVPLLDTHWRLVQLGAEVVDNPAGARDAHIILTSASNSISGDTGCNRIFGHYALENDMLKFD